MAAHGENAADLTLLASCEAQTGRLDKACALAARALSLDPTHVQAKDVARHLLARSERFDLGWNRRVARAGIPLALEPLDVDHARAFFWQYRDPQIAAMTRLRVFSDDDEVRSWIHRVNRAQNRYRYAVMDEDAGFVGYVSLRPSGADAHLGFWIGADHQGRGLGRQSARLLCEFAKVRGIQRVFAAAFDHNLRSIRALESIGFKTLGLRCASDDDPRTFMCFGESSIASAEAAFLVCMNREQPDLEWVDASGCKMEL
jgi:RimJ/RimL family protein N-acetyltransferase